MHVIALDTEETDQFFEPFTDDMPSYLYHRGHRYIKEFIYDWLLANVGLLESEQGNWSHDRFRGQSAKRPLAEWQRAFLFHNKEHAMLFKLTWENSDGL